MGNLPMSALNTADFPDSQLYDVITYIDQLGFLCQGSTRLFWVPTALWPFKLCDYYTNKRIAALSSVVALGTGSGAITIIHLPLENYSIIPI
jgi:hypothetical protein